MPDLLRQYRMLFQKMATGQSGSQGDLGIRSKLGGIPDWNQSDETPRCPDCSKLMSFVGQIDSIEHDEEHNPHRVDCFSDDRQYMFGDVGMIYIFFCFDCLQPSAVFQCG